MTQFEEAKKLVACAGATPLASSAFDVLMDAMDEIVGRTQNRPPDGEADGSIGENDWIVLCDLAEDLREARRAMFVFGVSSTEDVSDAGS